MVIKTSWTETEILHFLNLMHTDIKPTPRGELRLEQMLIFKTLKTLIKAEQNSVNSTHGSEQKPVMGRERWESN